MTEIQNYPKGSVIIREGSVQRNAFIIEKGTVEVSQLDENGIKKVLAVRGPKEIIGEMTLLEGGTRCATIIALEPCKVSLLTLDRFNDLPDSNPGVKAIRKIMNDRKKE